jgi:hypothetical protein
MPLNIYADADGEQAFPPAMPASLIFTAFGQVMQVRDASLYRNNDVRF